MDQSFNDIRCAVRDALAGTDKDKGADLCVCDLGPDWVVYEDPDTVGAGLHRRGYQIDSSGNVKFTSEPVPVVKQTTYSPVQAKTFSEASVQVRAHLRRSRAANSRQDPGRGTATQ